MSRQVADWVGAVTNISVVIAVIVISWLALGFLTGLAIRAAKFAMEL